MRHAETVQPRFWFGTAAGRALIPNLASGTGSGTWERRNCSGVIVRLDFHQRMGRLHLRAIGAVDVGMETRDRARPESS